MQIAGQTQKIEKKKVEKGFLTNCYAIKSCLNTMSVQYQIIINKSMEQSFVSCIQQTVRVLAEKYEFDYDDALALFGVDNLKFTTKLDKPKKVGDVDDAPKRTNPKFPLPFTGQVYGDCCRAIVFNSGLFTQCLKEPNPNSQNSLCQTCQKQAEKSPLGNPPLGYITDRIERGEDWADPKGRRPVPYTKVMKLKKFTQEEVMAEVSKYDMTLDLSVFDDTDTEKRGRKKGGKKTEVQSIFGDDEEEDDGLLGALIQEVKDGESETSEKSKTSKTSSKKSKEEREAEKQEKLSQKSENDMMKAEEKRLREIKKEEDKIAKEHEKKAKEQQKEALRLLKEAKEEEKRLAKEAKEQEKAAKEQEKAAKEAAKAAKEAAKADEKRLPVKAIKQDKMQQPEVVKEVEVEDVKEVEVEQLEELEEVEVEEPQSPLDPPPVEEPVIAVKPKMKKFKGPDGVSYVADANNIVYKKDAPTVRVGVLTPVGLELDDQEEEEEDLSDIE